TAIGVPETLIESAADAFRVPGERVGAPAAVFLSDPALEQTQRVVPKCIDLNRFAAPRRHHPIAHLRVHPRELIARRALPQEAVPRIDADAEMRAASVMVHDIEEFGQQQTKRLSIIGGSQIALDGMEVPERRVRRVIKPLTLAVGKKI